MGGRRWLTLLLASLSNDDGDGNENGNKAISLNWQNNNFARASRLFVHFSAVTARLPNLTFYGGREHKTETKIFFLFVNLETVLKNSTLEKSSTFDKLKELK